MKNRLVFALLLATIILTAVGGYQIYRKDHFAFGAQIFGCSISGKTVEEAYHILKRINISSEIKIIGNGENYSVIIPPKYQLSKKMLKNELTNKEITLPKNKNCVNEVKANLAKINFNEQPGEDAKLNFDGKIWKIIPEIPSTMVNRGKLEKKILELTTFKRVSKLKLADFYLPVKINANNADLKKRKEKANEFIAKTITLSALSAQRKLTRVDLINFLDESGEFNQEAIKSYLTNLNEEVAMINQDVRWKHPVDGKTYQFLNNHAWGWYIKVADAVQVLLKEFEKNEQIFEISLPIGGNVNENQLISNDFIWINLLDQTMHLYRNGVELVSTRIISGRNNRGTATVPGFHTIGGKNDNQTLKGQMLDGTPYAVPVKHFASLLSRSIGGSYYTGIGIHDSNKNYASVDAWKTLAGSNGCINTPPAAMEQIWPNIYLNMPVVITGDLYANSPGQYDKPVDLGRVA